MAGRWLPAPMSAPPEWSGVIATCRTRTYSSWCRHYGAVAPEAPLCGGEDVYVVGGGNSAGQAVMHLAKHARSVTMLVRDKTLAASMSLAAGDVRHRSIKRVATAAGEGAMAIAFVHRYLEETA